MKTVGDAVVKATSPTTIVIDLAASGIDLGKWDGFHMHYSDLKDANGEKITAGSMNITDARLLKSLSSNDPKPEPTKGTDNSSNPKTGVAPILPIALAAVACGGVLVVARKKK